MVEGRLCRGFVGTNADGVVDVWSAGLAEVLGVPEAQARGKWVWDALGVYPFQELCTQWDRAGRGQISKWWGLLLAHGSPRPFLLEFLPWIDRDGEQFGVLVLVRERATEGEYAEQLDEAKRISHTLQAVSGFVHDVSNVFTVLRTYAAMSDMDGDLALTREDWEMVSRVVTHGDNVTTALLATTRGGPMPAPQVVDLNQVVEQTTELVSRLMGASVELVVRPAEASLPVEVIPGQIERILLNLALNARDAMGGRGRLTIVLQEAELCAARPNRKSSDRLPVAVLSVADTGPGIAPKVQKTLFQPFVTTKPSGKGTGLGLASVADTVAVLGGTVDVSSPEGRGAEFRVTIPLVGTRTVTRRPRASTPPKSTRRAR